MTTPAEVSLREHVEALMSAQERRVELALDSANRAVAKAEAATEHRLAGLNEFRASLADQQRTLLTRAEHEAVVAGLRSEITDLKERVTRAEAMAAGASRLWGYIIGLIGLAAVVLGILARFGSAP